MQNSSYAAAIVVSPVTHYFALVTRMPKRLGTSRVLASMVRDGRAKSRAVQVTIESQRKLMRAEQFARREVA